LRRGCGRRRRGGGRGRRPVGPGAPPAPPGAAAAPQANPRPAAGERGFGGDHTYPSPIHKHPQHPQEGGGTQRVEKNAHLPPKEKHAPIGAESQHEWITKENRMAMDKTDRIFETNQVEVRRGGRPGGGRGTHVVNREGGEGGAGPGRRPGPGSGSGRPHPRGAAAAAARRLRKRSTGAEGDGSEGVRSEGGRVGGGTPLFRNCRRRVENIFTSGIFMMACAPPYHRPRCIPPKMLVL